MSDRLFRCSSLGKLMAAPKAGEVLSAGAKTFIRKLAAQEIFGVDFEIGGKPIEKGLRCEGESIALLNRVRGLSLTKNTERRADGFITGECDLFDEERRRGHDIKTSWSASTFPIVLKDAVDTDYEWQCRGYLKLWDAQEWEVNYCLVNTPENLIGYEPQSLHFFDHIPEHMRLTSWVVHRDLDLELSMLQRLRFARDYYREVIEEFDRTHPAPGTEARPRAEPAPPKVAPTAIPAFVF